MTHVHAYVIYKALCFDVAQGRMNGAPNETHVHAYMCVCEQNTLMMFHF